MFHSPAHKTFKASEDSGELTGAGPRAGTQTAELISLTSPDRADTETMTLPQRVRKSVDAIERASPNTTFTKSETPAPNPTAEARRLYQSAIAQLDASGNIKSTIKATVKGTLKKLYELVAKLDKPGEGKKEKTKQHTQHIELEKVTNEDILKEIRAVKEVCIGNVGRQKIEELGQGQMKILEEVKKNSIETIKAKEEVRLKIEEKHEQVRKDITEMKIEHSQNTSYAEVARQAPKLQKALHSIIVSSEDDIDSSQDIIGKVRTAVDAKTSGIRVDKVRRAKDQKVVIGCERKEEIERVKERIEKSKERLKIEETRNKDPLVILKDVMADMTDADITTALRVQNPHITEGIPEEDSRAEVRYRRKTRNSLQVHVVLSVSPEVWTKLVRAGTIHMDLQRVKVADQSPLVQCSRCLKFGHGKRNCTESVDLCAHCGGPHLRAECEQYKAYKPPQCHNCSLAGHDKSDHNAFDAACPIRARWDRLARTSVAYC